MKKTTRKEVAKATVRLVEATAEYQRVCRGTSAGVAMQAMLKEIDPEGDQEYVAATKMAHVTVLALVGKVMADAETNPLGAAEGLKRVAEFCQDFEKFLISAAVKQGALVESESAPGMYFSVMHQNDDGSVAPVTLDDVPEEDREALLEQLAEMERLAKAEEVPQGSAGYL